MSRLARTLDNMRLSRVLRSVTGYWTDAEEQLIRKIAGRIIAGDY